MNKTISTNLLNRSPLDESALVGSIIPMREKQLCLRLDNHVDSGSRTLIDAWIH